MKFLGRSSSAFLIGLAALFIVGCSGASLAQPTATQAPPEKTLRAGLPFLSQPPDPVKGGLHPIQTGLAETLFKLDKDLKPQPWLATGARQLDDRTWEIALREGVKFHNGEIMDAVAVKASLERAIANSARAKAMLDIAEVEAVNPNTLVVRSNNPSFILPGLLTEPTSAIVDAQAAAAMGDAFVNQAVLTGPFKVERFEQDRTLVAVKHNEYWGTPAGVDRVIFTYLPDNNSRVLAIQSGDIDIAMNIAPESVPAVESAPGLLVRSTAPVALEFMMLNHQRQTWQDLRVRQSIALAIDRSALVNAVMHGRATGAAGPLPPTMLACDQISTYPYDPDRARQLLADMGYTDGDGDGYVEMAGQSLTMLLLTYRQRPELVPMAEAVQGLLKTVGIKVEIRQVEDITAALRSGDWDAGMYFNNMVNTGDPYWALSNFFLTTGVANEGHYSNDSVTEKILQVGKTRDELERRRLACVASSEVVQDLAIIPLLYPHLNYAVSDKVTGFGEPHPFFLYFMDSAIGIR